MENERLVFKFYKSYFDTAKLLDDKNRLAFYDALLEKQFNFIEPTLSGLAELVYVSQKHNIDSQVNGWLEKIKSMGIAPPAIPPIAPPAIQLEKKYKKKNKEEKKKEIKYTCMSFDEFWDLYDKKVGKPNAIKLFEKTTEKERELIKAYIPKYKLSKPDVKYRKDPERFLKYRVWEDEIVSVEPEDKTDMFFANGKWHKKTPQQKYH